MECNRKRGITLLKPLVTKLIASLRVGSRSTQATSFSPMGSERKALSLGDMWSMSYNSRVGGRRRLENTLRL